MSGYGQFCRVAKATDVVGARHLIRTPPDWLCISIYANVRPGDPRMVREVAKD